MDNRLPKQILNYNPEGRRNLGRSLTRWEDDFQEEGTDQGALSLIVDDDIILKRPMKGRRYTTIEEIKTASLEELKTIPKSAHQKCFKDSKKRWYKCIISEGVTLKGTI